MTGLNRLVARKKKEHGIINSVPGIGILFSYW